MSTDENWRDFYAELLVPELRVFCAQLGKTTNDRILNDMIQRDVL